MYSSFGDRVDYVYIYICIYVGIQSKETWVPRMNPFDKPQSTSSIFAIVTIFYLSSIMAIIIENRHGKTRKQLALTFISFGMCILQCFIAFSICMELHRFHTWTLWICIHLLIFWVWHVWSVLCALPKYFPIWVFRIHTHTNTHISS